MQAEISETIDIWNEIGKLILLEIELWDFVLMMMD